MDVPHPDSPATTTTTGRSAGQADIRPDGAVSTGAAAQRGEPAPGRLLPGLWLATAIALVVAPFLTQFRIRARAGERSLSVDGWGRWDIADFGHDMRVGILFAAIALLLVVAATTVGWRQAHWPVWLGMSASVMAVTAAALQLAQLDASRRLWEGDHPAAGIDMTFGLGAWLVLVLGASAAVTLVVSLLRTRRLVGRAPQGTTPDVPLADRWPHILSGLWIAAAIGLAVAPFLTVHRVDAADGPTHLRFDGWGRTAGSLGIPCLIVAGGLAVAAIAMMRRRSPTFPLDVGLISGAGAVVIGGFLLLRLESVFALEHPPLTASVGPGTWLVLASGLLAAVTAVLALVRQRSLEAHQRVDGMNVRGKS